jgi:hypothetical protein
LLIAQRDWNEKKRTKITEKEASRIKRNQTKSIQTQPKSTNDDLPLFFVVQTTGEAREHRTTDCCGKGEHR